METINNNKEWKIFKEQPPEQNRLVVVFQYKRRRYIVARYRFFEKESDSFRKTDFWIAESGNTLNLNPNDYWCYLDPVVFVKTYD